MDGFTLLEGEAVHHNIRPSIAAFYARSIHLWLTIFALGLWLVVGFIWTRMSRYVVTDERMMRKTGILSKSSEEYRYEDTQQFQTKKRFIERLLGVGSLLFQTGTGGEAITYSGIKNHESVANTIRNELR